MDNDNFTIDSILPRISDVRTTRRDRNDDYFGGLLGRACRSPMTGIYVMTAAWDTKTDCRALNHRPRPDLMQVETVAEK